MHQTNEITEQEERRALFRNFVLELIAYGILVTGYFFVVLRWLAQPLNELFHNHLALYALVGLGLILVQGVVLELVTSFLLEQLQIERLE